MQQTVTPLRGRNSPTARPPKAVHEPPTGEPGSNKTLRDSLSGRCGGLGSGGSIEHTSGERSATESVLQTRSVLTVTLPVQDAPEGCSHEHGMHSRVSSKSR